MSSRPTHSDKIFFTENVLRAESMIQDMTVIALSSSRLALLTGPKNSCCWNNDRSTASAV